MNISQKYTNVANFEERLILCSHKQFAKDQWFVMHNSNSYLQPIKKWLTQICFVKPFFPVTQLELYDRIDSLTQIRFFNPYLPT